MGKTRLLKKKALACLCVMALGAGGLLAILSGASDGRYTVEKNIVAADIAALHSSNLIGGKLPYLASKAPDAGEDIARLTDSLGTHIDFGANDGSNLRFVFKLDRPETVGSLLYAGFTGGASNATGKYEFYLADSFNELNEPAFWSEANRILAYDNTEDKTYAQKITFTTGNRPAGQYLGLRITDVSVASGDNCARIAEIGVYPPAAASGEIIVDAQAQRGAHISPPGKIAVPSGGTQSFTVSVDAGYEIKSVTAGGQSVQLTEGAYLFTAGQENAEIRVAVNNVQGYTVDTDIKDKDINTGSAFYTENLIKDAEPFFISHDSDPNKPVMKMTDGKGAGTNDHVDFYVDDSANLRMVYDLGSITEVRELLFAGHNSTTNTTGAYEFYVFDVFDPQNEPSPWPLENRVVSYSNLAILRPAQKITFEEDRRPVGRYVGLRITDVSVETAWADNNARIAEIGVYGEELQTHTISASAGAGGRIEPSGAVPVIAGQSKTFTVTPNSGYEVDAVEVDGTAVSLTQGKYVFLNVQADAVITATFRLTAPMTLNPDVTAAEITAAHDDNLIGGFLPYFTGEYTGIDGAPSKLTDGDGAAAGAHIDFYASDADRFRLVYDLRASATIDALLCAGPAIPGMPDYRIGKYEFYVFDTFDDATSWTEANKVYTCDNTQAKTSAQKVTFHTNKPSGRYVGILFTDVSTAAGNDNCVRISELGIYGLLANKAPTPAATFHAVSRTLSGIEPGQKYRINSGEWMDAVADLSEIVTGACTIQLYAPGPREGVADSDVQTITVTKAAKPQPAVTNESSAGKNDGKISGVNAAMEYRKADGQWANVTGGTIENLAPGTYHVRVKAAGQALESDHAVAAIQAGQAVYQQQTLTDTEQAVSLDGMLTAGAVLTVAPIASNNPQHAVMLELVDTAKNQAIAAYEVTVTGDYTGTLKLTFTVGSEYDGQTLTVYHKKSGGIETYAALCENGKITIETDELSPFLITAQKSGEPVESTGSKTTNPPQTTDTDSEIPSTGDTGSPIFAALLASLFMAGLVLVLMKRGKAA